MVNRVLCPQVTTICLLLFLKLELWKLCNFLCIFHKVVCNKSGHHVVPFFVSQCNSPLYKAISPTVVNVCAPGYLLGILMGGVFILLISYFFLNNEFLFRSSSISVHRVCRYYLNVFTIHLSDMKFFYGI